MKKITVIAIIFAFFITKGNAQDNQPVNHHEFTGSIILLGDVQIIGLAVDVVGGVLTLGQAVRPGSYNFITPSINYKYWFNRRVALGTSVLLDINSVLIRRAKGESFEERTRYIPTFAAEFSVHYLNSKWVQLYGMVGTGVSIAISPDAIIKTVVIPNFHLSPFGLRVGKDIGGFFEIGYGYKGILNFGISYKF
ncbi:MAG: hypothetical protein LBR17_01070 [Bacteroidales bacterium]|nr:hypothetical protein [Bacteroidales bacterium]